MHIVTNWCKTESEPITLDIIASELVSETTSRNSVKNAMRSLEKQGYVRKAIRTKRVSYVKVRGI